MKQLHLKDISREHEVFVYGAGNNTEALIPYLEKYFPQLIIKAILVSDPNSNKKTGLGVPVIPVKDVCADQKHIVVLISTKDKYVPEIVDTLISLGFERYISMAFESEGLEDLRIIALRDIFAREGKTFVMTDDLLMGKHVDNIAEKEFSMSVNMVKCHLDKEIKEQPLQKYKDYLLPLQVGSTLTNLRVAERTDNLGDNISELNPQYCELTGTYWIWKNDESNIKGLCHYRRLFKLTDEEIRYLFNVGVDAILTVPILCRPNVRAIYERDHNINDWNCMIEIIKNDLPAYYENARKMEESEYYYGYNMVIARREVFDDYCKFLFPVLKKINSAIIENRNTHNENYQKRYIGFLAERLTSLYFLTHLNYKTVSSKKIFLN